MPDDIPPRDDDALPASNGPARTGPVWLTRKCTHAERKWIGNLRLELEKAGYGSRRVCDMRARRCLLYRRLTEHELDAIAVFGLRDYERGHEFLEETFRLLEQRQEPPAAPSDPGVDPLA